MASLPSFLSYLFTLLLSANPVKRLRKRHEFLGRSGDFSAQHGRTAPLAGARTQRLPHVAVSSALATSLFRLRSPSIREDSAVRQEGQDDRFDSVRIWALFSLLGFMSVCTCDIQERISWWGSSPTRLEVFGSHLFPSVLNTAFKCLQTQLYARHFPS